MGSPEGPRGDGSIPENLPQRDEGEALPFAPKKKTSSASSGRPKSSISTPYEPTSLSIVMGSNTLEGPRGLSGISREGPSRETLEVNAACEQFTERAIAEKKRQYDAYAAERELRDPGFTAWREVISKVAVDFDTWNLKRYDLDVETLNSVSGLSIKDEEEYARRLFLGFSGVVKGLEYAAGVRWGNLVRVVEVAMQNFERDPVPEVFGDFYVVQAAIHERSHGLRPVVVNTDYLLTEKRKAAEAGEPFVVTEGHMQEAFTRSGAYRGGYLGSSLEEGIAVTNQGIGRIWALHQLEEMMANPNSQTEQFRLAQSHIESTIKGGKIHEAYMKYVLERRPEYRDIRQGAIVPIGFMKDVVAAYDQGGEQAIREFIDKKIGENVTLVDSSQQLEEVPETVLAVSSYERDLKLKNITRDIASLLDEKNIVDDSVVTRFDQMVFNAQMYSEHTQLDDYLKNIFDRAGLSVEAAQITSKIVYEWGAIGEKDNDPRILAEKVEALKENWNALLNSLIQKRRELEAQVSEK